MGRLIFMLVEIEGFEPSLTEPESVVLPLHHISMLSRFTGLQMYDFFLNPQEISRKNLQLFRLFLERIAGGAGYQGIFVNADLPTQAGHGGICRAGIGQRIVRPDGLNQVLTGELFVGVLHE